MEISGAYLWAGLATGVTPKHVSLKKHQKQVTSAGSDFCFTGTQAKAIMVYFCTSRI
jgi:hypothetical protein